MRICYGVVSGLLLLTIFAATDGYAEQTLVFIRHGEKPAGGLGQLTCQGLNRALALSTVLSGRYGKPTFLYAPNPAVKVNDSAGSFYYVRPLATIEPTAIKLQMPVNTRYGYNDITNFQAALITPAKDNTTTFIAWEHIYLQKLVQNLMNVYGGGVTVPAWASTDYDSVFVLHITYGVTINAVFHHDMEGLNGQSAICP